MKSGIQNYLLFAVVFHLALNHQMKSLFILLFLSFASIASGQSSYSKDGKGFDSFFQKKIEGSFNGSVSGILEFKSKGGEQSSSSFSKDFVNLNIVPDLDSVYDISTKNYILKTKDFHLEYRTYAFANALFITKGGIRYKLNLIDGGCDLVIKGLEYQYVRTPGTELLILNFYDDVGLFVDKPWATQELFILKGSTIVFTIEVPENEISISSNLFRQSAPTDDPASMYQKKTYSLSNDSVKAVLKVIQYSKAIINYEISIKTAKGKIEQKGYALNLSSELNGGVEYETDERGDALQVNPYISYICGCPAQNDLEIRISTDKKKVSIYSSRKLRQDLFSDKIKPNAKLEGSVQLFGYLFLEE